MSLMTLHKRRHTLLMSLKRLDPEVAVDMAARHYALLVAGPVPRWLDMDAVDERKEEIDETRALEKEYRRDQAALKKNDMDKSFTAWWNEILPILRYRFDETSSDRIHFWRMACQSLLHGTLCLDTQASGVVSSHFPLVPRSDQTLVDLFDIWLELDQVDSIHNHLFILEAALMQTVLYDELARNTHGLPVSNEMLAVAWRHAIIEGLACRGAWLDDCLLWPMTKLFKVHGVDTMSAGLVAMMKAADDLETHIDKIQGPAWIQIMEEDRIHRFYRLWNGQYDGDDTGWIHLSVRAALILGMTNEGSLLIERRRPLNTENVPIRDVYAATLCDEQWGWLTREACKSVHEYSMETGMAMPRDPGKIYRGYYEDFPDMVTPGLEMS